MSLLRTKRLQSVAGDGAGVRDTVQPTRSGGCLSTVNAGDLGDVSGLQPLVAAAVAAADSAAEHHAQAIRDESRERIDEWIARTATWKQLALNMTQYAGLRQRTRRIDDEQALAEEMNPDRRLVRPLVVVVPAH